MINEKAAFWKFIERDSCSQNDFRLARSYFRSAPRKEQNLYVAKINYIVLQGLQTLIEIKSANLKQAQVVYQKYGMSGQDFQYAFSGYMTSYASAEIQESFLALTKGEPVLPNSILFEEAKQVLWQNKALISLAKKYYITVDLLRLYLEKYTAKHYGILLQTYQTYYKQFKKFIAGDNCELAVKKNVYHFYEACALPQEQEEFKNYARKVLVKIGRIIDQDSIVTNYLERHKLTDFDLYRFCQIAQQVDPNLQLKIYARFKKYYDYAAKVRFILLKIRDTAFIHGMEAKNFLDLATVYASEILKNNHIKEDILASRRGYSKPLYAKLNTIKEETDVEVIKELLKKENVQPHEISVYCYGVNSQLPKIEQQKLERKLLTCLKEVKSQKQKNKENKYVAKPDYTLYYDYLNTSLDIQEWCSLHSITINILKTRIKSIKNRELAQQVFNKLQIEVAADLNYKITIVQELLSYIKRGMTVNGIHREFNLFDYFYYFGKLNIHHLQFYNLSLSGEDKNLLNKLFRPLQTASYLNPDVIIHSNYEFNSLKDQDGFPIKGTGKILSVEELTQIVNIFLDNGIPLYDMVVNIAIPCYANGALVEQVTLQRK